MSAINFLTNPESLSQVTLGSIQVEERSTPVKPRRRLGDRKEDDVIGGLIQKTRAIELNTGEDLLIVWARQSRHLLKAFGGDEGQWIHGLYSQDYNHNYWAVKKIRKYVCGQDSEAHAQNILSWQILPRLKCFLCFDCPENLIFETLWIITNIAAGPTVHTSAIVESEFLPLLNHLLLHPSGSIRTQATWSIGNIVGDREGYRDVVLQNCSLTAILHIWQGDFLDEQSRKEAFRISMWVVDNMCRYRPDWHLMEPAFTIIPDYLNHDDPLLLKECCWAVARIFHGAGRYAAIDAMITPELCQRLISILSFNNMMTTHPILRGMINLSSSKNVKHLEYVIQAGILHELELILTTRRIPDSCRVSLDIFTIQIIGNLCSHHQIALQISETDLVHHLTHFLETSPDHSLRKEACIAVRNATSHKDHSIAKKFVDANLVCALLHYLQAVRDDTKAKLPIIETLIDLFRVGDTDPTPTGSNLFVDMVNRAGAFGMILDTYLLAAGRNLEEMDTIDHDQQDGDESGDDEMPTLTQPLMIRDKLARKTKLVLRNWFLEKFQETLRDAQMSQELFSRLDSLSVDPENQKSSIADLIQEFSTLSPTKSKTINVVSSQRTESETTLAET